VSIKGDNSISLSPFAEKQLPSLSSAVIRYCFQMLCKCVYKVCIETTRIINKKLGTVSENLPLTGSGSALNPFRLRENLPLIDSGSALNPIVNNEALSSVVVNNEFKQST
jgi:hypothetical protein